MAPIEALFESFRAKGCDVVAIFAPSLKAPDAAGWLRRHVRALKPDAIVNATSFSGKGADGTSPLDAANVPVFQVALGTSRKKAWAESERGLSPTDLAMHVVLPEVDGRIFAGVASFKEPGKRDADLEYSRFSHRPVPERIAAITDQVMGWVTLGDTPPTAKSAAIVLSTYPGKDWNMAHAVGLDALASTDAILDDLDTQGWRISKGAPLQEALKETIAWPLTAYEAALKTLPTQLQDDLKTAWGNAATDPLCVDGALRFPATRRGAVLVALQPERGEVAMREDDYHDLARTPRHAYVAFYLWLRAQSIHALIHVGAHGTLEWLPGKSVALSNDCWPERALTGNHAGDLSVHRERPGRGGPGQAAHRGGGARDTCRPATANEAGAPERLACGSRRCWDEFSNADGLDPGRRDRLQGGHPRRGASHWGSRTRSGPRHAAARAPPRRSPGSTGSCAT